MMSFLLSIMQKNCIISSTRPRLSGARNYTHVLFALSISSSVLGTWKISVFLMHCNFAANLFQRRWFLIVYIWGCWRLDIESLQSIAINILIFLLGDPHPIYPIWPGKGPPSKFICLCFQFKACVIQGKFKVRGTQACLLLIMWLFISYLTAQSLSYPICKLCTISPLLQQFCRD